MLSILYTMFRFLVFMDVGNIINFEEIRFMTNYRTAAMFKTFGLEEKLTKSFVSHWRSLIRRARDPIERRKMLRKFRMGKPVYIGGSNVKQILQAIVEHYGEPQLRVPSRVLFGIMRREGTDEAGYSTEANFLIDSVNGDFYILIASSGIFDIPTDIASMIEHETQHFIKSLYEGRISPDKDSGSIIESHYGDPWEIQAYAGNIAKTSAIEMTSMFEMRAEGKSEALILGMKKQMLHDKDYFVKNFFLPKINRFFKEIETYYKESFPVELKREYYQAALRDFSRLFDEYFSAT